MMMQDHMLYFNEATWKHHGNILTLD